METLTGLTGGTGSVRIKADLYQLPTIGTDHTWYSEVEGWKETPLAVCCRTDYNPYLRETAFTGTVSVVSGLVITLANVAAHGPSAGSMMSTMPTPPPHAG